MTSKNAYSNVKSKKKIKAGHIYNFNYEKQNKNSPQS